MGLAQNLQPDKLQTSYTQVRWPYFQRSTARASHCLNLFSWLKIFFDSVRESSA